MDASVTLSLNSSAFAQGIQQAEAQARSFSGRISGLSKGIEGLFRRSPERRAELAIHGLVSSLASGDVSGGIANLIGGMSGLGLAAGVGIGAGVAAFVKFKSQIDATTKATEALRKEIGKPLSFQAALGAEGIGKEVDSISKAIDDLATKRKSIGSRIQEAAIAGSPDLADTSSAAALKASLETPTDRTNPAAEAQTEGEKRLKGLVEARATAELKAVQIRRTGLTVSEREGDALKIQADFVKKEAELYFSHGPGTPGYDKKQYDRSHDALVLDKQLTATAGKDKADQRDRELKLAKDIANIESGSLGPAQSQNLAIARAKVEALIQQVNLTHQLPTQARADLGTKLKEEQTALKKAQGVSEENFLPSTISMQETKQGKEYFSDQNIPSVGDIGQTIRDSLTGIADPNEIEAAVQSGTKFWKENAPQPLGQGGLEKLMGASALRQTDLPPGVIDAAVSSILPPTGKNTVYGKPGDKPETAATDKMAAGIEKLNQKMDTYWGK